MTIDDVCQIAKILMELSPEGFKIVECKLQNATEEPLTFVCNNKTWDKYGLLLLLEWEDKLRNSKEPATKKALAKLLKESAEEVENSKDHELLKCCNKTDPISLRFSK